jgi:hypothetical protein
MQVCLRVKCFKQLFELFETFDTLFACQMIQTSGVSFSFPRDCFAGIGCLLWPRCHVTIMLLLQ